MFLKILFLALSLISVGDALKCYNCSSSFPSDQECLKPTTNRYALTCANNQSHCVKITLKTGSLETVERRCGSQQLNTCLNVIITACSHSCSTDLCNSATKPHVDLRFLSALMIGWVVILSSSSALLTK
uniref:Uncharacterized LOC101242363 n=1 Tax=Ciona intestinalis TaxID=7719 RepID=F7A7S2_CIOIN|nr:uncharacterized protein LOC101242363 [Ciona intestinalis]|eukprot:XP_004226737.1 uncharacterized protein LOC101242363 [Ciona intestinalis]